MFKRELIVIAVLVLVFMAIRLPGLTLPYHQDEWKTGEIMRSNIVGGLAAHPPLTELTYRWSSALVGPDMLRITPFVFGGVSLLLLYVVVRSRAGRDAALLVGVLYAISTYGVFASLMIDVDGSILATYFLLAIYAYDRARSSMSWRSAAPWISTAVIACALALLSKLSAVLIIGALAVDLAIEKREYITRAVVVRAISVALLTVVATTIFIYVARYIVPGFDSSKIIDHVLYYVKFSERGYFQTGIQVAKATMYLSPLLVFPILFTSRAVFGAMRVFFVFIALAGIFYFVLFDFSHGALDKYLMCLIVPFAAISGTTLMEKLRDISKREILIGLGGGTILSCLLLWLALLPHDVVPQHPKSEWISAVLSGQWDILFPFTGGNGPIGVYFSILVIIVAFTLSAALALVYGFSRQRVALVAFIGLGVMYCGMFTQEYLFGNLYGSAPAVLTHTLAYIESNPDIRRVITHGDTGAYEPKGIGAYAGRFYAVPEYEEAHRKLFAEHIGHYLVVEVPQLNPSSFYSKFFETCASLFQTSSGKITGNVYDCSASSAHTIQ